MGGASRSEKRRRQEAANQRLAAAGITTPTKKGAGTNRTALIVVGVAVGAAVLVGLFLLNREPDEAVVASYPVTASGAVITAAGGSSGPVVDVYSDYICAGCDRFEESYGDEIARALNAGQVSVRHHAVGLLDDNSDPAGYSSRAANAAVCAVPAGIFPAYHERLFAEQPAGGAAGPSGDELVAFGVELGAPAGFAECVRSGSNAEAVAAETQAMIDNPALRNAEGQVATPTVLVDGERVDLNDTGWLASAISAG